MYSKQATTAENSLQTGCNALKAFQLRSWEGIQVFSGIRLIRGLPLGSPGTLEKLQNPGRWALLWPAGTMGTVADTLQVYPNRQGCPLASRRTNTAKVLKSLHGSLISISQAALRNFWPGKDLNFLLHGNFPSEPQPHF